MAENETVVIRCATIKKFNRLLDRRSYITQQREALNRESLTVEEEIEGCRTVAKLFHFDLPEVAQESDNQDSSKAAPPSIEVSESQKKRGSRQKSVSDGTVKEFVLNHMKEIYPETIRSRNLQEIYERETGQIVHEKTIGMTLYRLLKDGLVSRDGWNWQLVPTVAPSSPADEAVVYVHGNDAQTDGVKDDINDELSQGGQHALPYRP